MLQINFSHIKNYNSSFDVNIFLYEFKTLLESGLSIIEVIQTLLDRGEVYTAVLSPIYQDLKAGFSFSQSLTHQPEIFPKLLIATVKSTEQTGQLSLGLERYLTYMENINVLKNKITSASIYPLTVLVIGFVIFTFLLLYLIPKFSLIYNDLDLNLPFLSNLLIKLGGFIYQYKIYTIITFIILLGTTLYFRKNIIKNSISYALKFKRISYYYNAIVLTRFYRALSLMLDGGYPLISALDTCKETLNDDFKHRIESINQGLKQGEVFSLLLEQHQLTTPIASRLIKSGEKNGNISRMLAKTADFHDLEVSRFIDKLSKVIEPVLMIVIGGFVGMIVILLYLPIFDMVGSL